MSSEISYVIDGVAYVGVEHKDSSPCPNCELTSNTCEEPCLYDQILKRVDTPEQVEEKKEPMRETNDELVRRLVGNRNTTPRFCDLDAPAIAMLKRARSDAHLQYLKGGVWYRVEYESFSGPLEPDGIYGIDCPNWTPPPNMLERLKKNSTVTLELSDEEKAMIRDASLGGGLLLPRSSGWEPRANINRRFQLGTDITYRIAEDWFPEELKDEVSEENDYSNVRLYWGSYSGQHPTTPRSLLIRNGDGEIEKGYYNGMVFIGDSGAEYRWLDNIHWAEIPKDKEN